MAAFNWTGEQAVHSVLNIGPLAVLAPLLDRLDLADIIDRHLPPDPQLEYSHGAVLSLLLAARIAQPTALVNVAEWAEKSGAELLWNIPADKLNDDRLGRALDAFFEQRHAIQAAATLHALRLADLSLERVHFDPTHVLFQGAYASSQPRPGDMFISPLRSSALIDPAHITHGYLAKDQKMVQVGAAAVVDKLGAVPIFAHVVGGNQNGHTAISEHFELLRHHLPLPDRLLMISDRGTFSAGHVARLAKHGYHVLCSVPWGDFRDLYDAHAAKLDWHEASYLSIEQHRRRDTGSSLPKEH
jgi:transposase